METEVGYTKLSFQFVPELGFFLNLINLNSLGHFCTWLEVK